MRGEYWIGKTANTYFRTMTSMIALRTLHRADSRYMKYTTLYFNTHPRRNHDFQLCLKRSLATSTRTSSSLKSNYDAVIIGAGHNGLVCAAYLQKSGLSVCVLERRHVVGGAAVTEEIIPGFKFSRASYLLSLMRPQIFTDLELKRHGVEVYLRNPNSYTPLIAPRGKVTSLLLGSDQRENHAQIAQFSTKDAQAFANYESHLERMISSLDPLLDSQPVNLHAWTGGRFTDKLNNLSAMRTLVKSGLQLRGDTAEFYELMTAPASKVLDKWFESEPLKATLATDSVIGAMTSPRLSGSGYVLLHHVMGELEGVKGAWGYVKGGMGALSHAIAKCAEERGASIFTETAVSEVLMDSQGAATGVLLQDGRTVKSKVVLSNATPKVTFLDLVPQNVLPPDFVAGVKAIDYTSPVTKINVAVNKLPNFVANPNKREGEPLPHHQTTIHLNCERSDYIHEAYVDALNGQCSKRPVIEMTIPSVLDTTVAPPGGHVVQLFTQYTPYTLDGDKQWDQQAKDQYADTVFNCIEDYAPGFKASVVGRDILTPRDIEDIFGLTGGNIFHGAMSLDQLYMMRPLPAHSDYRSPIKGLYLCGSGAHPGGGVMGSPGRIAAEIVSKDVADKRV